MFHVVYLECVVAGLLRLWLMNSQYKNVITDRVEVSTPLNSWKKVTEGIFLYNHGIDPYIGDLFHDTPLNLQIYKYIIQYCDKYLQVVFVLFDILTACLLYKTAIRYLLEFSEEEKQNKNVKKDGKSLLLKNEDIKLAPTYVVTSYLFNPYIIFNCVGMTTTTFTNFLLAVAFFGMIYRSRLLSCFGLAFATCQSFYPLLLILPASIYIFKNPNAKYTERNKILSFMLTFTVFIVLLTGLLFVSKYLSGSWNFLYNMYGFILNVPDLRPNIGLFWYFFTEMFEHFRALFISAFQINATLLYLVPLTLRLHNDPMLLAVSISALTSIFRSYPSLGDVGLYLSLYPMWKHLFNYMQQGFIIGCFFLITSVLGPTVWHLWIYARSANANFYFGVTLAFATAQIFLLTDILFAYIKRDFSLEHGLVREIKGKTAKLVLE